ncbi:MAG: DUF523 domain-containing protein [Anaerofustis sp.]
MKEKQLIGVSACLLGENCKYNGGNNYSQKVADYVAEMEVITFCPEVLGGLSVPRDACEIVADETGMRKVMTESGSDVTEQYVLGAQKTLDLLLQSGVARVILQPRSPSCGFGKIYDGTFSGKLIDGNGITAELLSEHGIALLSEEDL